MSVRAARRALFSRPTPLADALLLASRAHRVVDSTFVVLCVLLLIRFFWQLSGYAEDGTPFDLLTLLTGPTLDRLSQEIPPVRLSDSRWIDLSSLIGIALGGLITRGLHRLIHLVVRRKGTDWTQETEK